MAELVDAGVAIGAESPADSFVLYRQPGISSTAGYVCRPGSNPSPASRNRKGRAGSSNPGRASGLHPEGCGFESRPVHFAIL